MRDARQGRPSVPQGPIPPASNARRRERLAQQVPRSWPGENPADVALFDDSVLATLPAELAGEVTAVREAIRQATEGQAEELLKTVPVIPRSSPLSEWRLFLRGLVDWLGGNYAI